MASLHAELSRQKLVCMEDAEEDSWYVSRGLAQDPASTVHPWRSSCLPVTLANIKDRTELY